jgi:hypothetical protein
VVPSPSPAAGNSLLNAVSCVSASACTAVGYHNGATEAGTLAESWNGTTWSVVPSPAKGVLDGVSCVSAGACVAVGRFTGGTLAESWNGTTWSVVPSPNKGTGGLLSGVSCVPASGCTAAGDYTRTVNGIEQNRTLVESNSATR